MTTQQPGNDMSEDRIERNPQSGETSSAGKTCGAGLIPKREGEVWTYQLAFSQTSDGRSFQVLIVTDDLTQACLAVKADWRIRPEDVITQLLDLFRTTKGIPASINSRTGLESTANKVQSWLERIGVATRAVETMGFAQQYCRTVDEAPYGETYHSLDDARVRLKSWQRRHNDGLAGPPVQRAARAKRSHPGRIVLSAPGKTLLIGLMATVAVLSLAGRGSFAFLNDSETARATFYAGTWGPQPVSIDIEPGDLANRIHIGSNGVIRVAILTTAGFDATYVDGASVRFGPGGAVPFQWNFEDVDRDGYRDMVLKFHTGGTGLNPRDTVAEITGETVSGTAIEGTDMVQTTDG
jgi:predicted ribosomally synthesized peptide with SipW-like signal peptide